MNKLLTRSAGCLLVIGVLACGGTPTPPPKQPPPTEQSGAGTKIAAEPEAGGPEVAADVSPVPAPAEIVGTLRWKNPAASMAALANYAKMPAGFVDANVRAGIKEMLHDKLSELVDPGPFAEAVATDAPLDVVLAVDTKGTQPKPLMATAFGLSSLRGALGALKSKPKPVGPGMWQLGSEESWGPRCVIAAAAGRAPARMVCGDRMEEVVRLAPFMARTMPTQPDGPADISLDVHLKGLSQKYGQMLANQARGLPMLAEELKLNIPGFDKAVDEAATALAEEAAALIFDVDAIKLDLTVDAQRGAVVSGKLGFAGKKSWLVGTMVEGANLAGPAPEAMWRLPKDTETLSWGHMGDPGRYTKILANLQALLQGGLEKLKFASPADHAAMAKLLRLPFGKDVATVAATGHFSGATAVKAGAGSFFDRLFGSSIGWSVMGVEENSTALRAYLSEAVQVYNRPTLQAAIKKEMHSDAKYLPIVKTVPAPGSLGAGSLDIEVRIPNVEDPMAEAARGPMAVPPPPPVGHGGPKAPKPVKAAKVPTTNITFHVLLMADGQRTWIGFGVDREALAKLMATVKGTGPAADGIETRPGMLAFKRGRHVSGGMLTLQSVIGAIKPGLSMAMQMGGASPEVQQILTLLEQLPNKGMTPMIMVGDATEGGAPSTSFEMTIPRESLEDVGYIVRNVMSLIK